MKRILVSLLFVAFSQIVLAAGIPVPMQEFLLTRPQYQALNQSMQTQGYELVELRDALAESGLAVACPCAWWQATYQKRDAVTNQVADQKTYSIRIHFREIVSIEPVNGPGYFEVITELNNR